MCVLLAPYILKHVKDVKDYTMQHCRESAHVQDVKGVKYYE